MNKTIIVYGLCGDDGELRYVGQTSRSSKQRLTQHLSYAKMNKMTAVHKWIVSRLGAGDTIHIVILASDAVWNETEKQVIAFHRASGSKLLNHTDGGEGTLGFHHSGRKRPDLAERNKANIGKPGRPRIPGETEKLMSYIKGSKRPWVSERNRLGKGKPGHKHTDEHKRRMREIYTGRPYTEEQIAKQRLTRASWSAERRAEISMKISISKKAANAAKREAGNAVHP